MSRRPAWWLPVLAKIWPLTWKTAEASTWPVIGGTILKMVLPLFSKENLDISYIPINQDIKGAGSTLLPREVAEELIRRSSHRVIINKCTCRDARKCKEHPIDYGCTLLGDGTKEIDPRIARHVSVEEAIEHVERTIHDGLMTMVGRVKIDNYIWGVRDRRKLLTICHCCRCCCTILASAQYFPKEAIDSLKPLSGLRIEVDNELCTQCETCLDECFINAISADGTGIHHNRMRCKGCGRCALVCPNGATTLIMDDMGAAIDEVVGRVSTLIDIE